jgi:hypothetical protein
MALLLLTVLILSSCTTTKNYTIIYFDKDSIGDKASVELSMDAQFSTSKTVSPSTDLEATIPLRELKDEVKKLREQQRELQNQ